jgi:hypothetical protein
LAGCLRLIWKKGLRWHARIFFKRMQNFDYKKDFGVMYSVGYKRNLEFSKKEFIGLGHK